MKKDNRVNRHGVSYESIRNAARAGNAERYRITSNDALEYYGTYPNSNEVGWYFVRWCSDIRVIDEKMNTY